MSNLRPGVFLDRDGVINNIVWRQGMPVSPRTFSEFVLADGIQEAVQRLKAAALPVFVVTNQPDIARHKMTAEALEQMTAAVYQALPIDDLRICPHDNDDDCACRKPRPGMLIELAQQWPIDLSRSFIVGDSWKDMAAGKQAGCRTVLIARDYNRETAADFAVTDVLAAATLILEMLTNPTCAGGL
ncbi:MAG TPA: HAD family hydrolase [Coleofasciculaceae cyanobacterium]